MDEFKNRLNHEYMNQLICEFCFQNIFRLPAPFPQYPGAKNNIEDEKARRREL